MRNPLVHLIGFLLLSHVKHWAWFSISLLWRPERLDIKWNAIRTDSSHIALTRGGRTKHLRSFTANLTTNVLDKNNFIKKMNGF